MPKTTQPVQFHSMQSHRFHVLDGLRGIAAILVLLFHMPLFLRPSLLLENGWLAVDFFFCLSGFVIAFSYESRLRRGLTMKDFFAARLIRLYPLYIAGTLLGILSNIVVNSLSAHVKLSIVDLALATPFAILLIPNFLNHWPHPYCFPLNLAAWSLFYEIFANLAFAFLLVRRLGNDVIFSILAGSSLLILLAAALRGAVNLDAGPLLDTFALGFARVGYSFLAGVLIFRAYRSRTRPFPKLLRTWIFPLLATFGVIAVIATSFKITLSTHYQFLAIAVIFPSLLYLGAASELPSSWTRICAFLGDFSYPLYILHLPLVFPLRGSTVENFSTAHPTIAQWIIPIVTLALIALAWAAGKYYDKNCRKWLSHRYNARTVKA